MREFRTLLFYLFVFLFLGQVDLVHAAGSVTLTTYYSAPYGDYVNAKANDTIVVGDAAAPNTVNIYGDVGWRVLDINHNNPNPAPWPAPNEAQNPASRGGDLIVRGNFLVRDSLGNPSLFVDSATRRVGIGTTTPRADLEVRGDTTALITHAHEDHEDYRDPWVEIFAQGNGPDNLDSAIANDLGWWAKFAGIFKNTVNPLPISGYTFCTIHLDGAPVVFQTQPKPEVGGNGQVAIRGIARPDLFISDNVIFTIGEQAPAPAYGVNIPVVAANAWAPVACSRLNKKDIIPLGPQAYQGMLSKLAQTDLVKYRYKSVSTASKEPPLQIGFIAEAAPDEIVSASRKFIDYNNEMGFLCASLKALKMENEEIRQRIERLKK